MSESSKKENYDINRRLETIIGIMLNQSKIQNKTLGEKIVYLSSQGYENQEIANILTSSSKPLLMLVIYAPPLFIWPSESINPARNAILWLFGNEKAHSGILFIFAVPEKPVFSISSASTLEFIIM